MIASGLLKEVRIGRQTAVGVASPAVGAKFARVSSTIDQVKDAFQSNTRRPSQMTSDVRHGVSRIEGALDGELIPGAWSAIMETVLRRDFTVGASAAGITVNATTTAPHFTRTTGSFLTDGFKRGDVVRFTGFTTAAANNNRNYRIVALTATQMTVGSDESEAVVAEAGATVTVSVVGRKTFFPVTGHIFPALTIEHWFPDIGKSETFIDMRASGLDIGLPVSGMASVRTGFLGTRKIVADTAHFASPAEPVLRPGTAGVTGLIRLNGVDVGVITGASISIQSGIAPSVPTMRSKFIKQVFPGYTGVNGSIQAYLEDFSLQDLYAQESEFELVITYTSSDLVNADFVNFVLPRVKLMASNKDDSLQGIMQSMSFTATENLTGGAGQPSEATVLSIQDSSLT